MKNKLHFSLVQSNIFWKEKKRNLTHFEKLISDIKHTDIILLPEMFNTAFCINSTDLSEDMQGETIKWMKKIATQKHCAISGSLMVTENNRTYNRLVWISKKGETYIYDKYHLFSLIKEQENISKGKKRVIIKTEGWSICPLICYDLRFPVFSRNDVNYDLLIYLANWPTSRIDAWDTLLKARAIENQCYTIGVNRIGKDGNGFDFSGHSTAFDPSGNELISKSNKEEVLKLEINFEKLKLQRKEMNFLADRDSFRLF